MFFMARSGGPYKQRVIQALNGYDDCFASKEERHIPLLDVDRVTRAYRSDRASTATLLSGLRRVIPVENGVVMDLSFLDRPLSELVWILATTPTLTVPTCHYTHIFCLE